MTKPQYPFAFDALPRPGKFGLPLLEAAVKEAIADRKVPPKMPYFTAASVYCALAQLTSDVSKPVGGTSGVGAYMLVIADSGERKTAIRNDFFSPLDKVTGELKTQFEKEKKEFEIHQRNWKREESALAALRNAARKKGQDPEVIRKATEEHDELKPAHPREMKLTMKGTTMEALMRALSDYPCIHLYSGDCSGLLKSMILPNAPALCDVWSSEPINEPRATVEDYYCEDPRANLFLMMQEKPLPKILASEIGQNADDCGFFSRFFISDCESTQGSRFISVESLCEAPSEHHRNRYRANVEKLLGEGIQAMKTPEFQRRKLKFSELSAHMWINYANYVEEQCQKGRRYEHARDHASKLPDNAARLAAAFHVCERFKGDEIGLECLAAAIVFCNESSIDYIKKFSAQSKLEQDAMLLYEWLVKKLRDEPAGKTYGRIAQNHDLNQISKLMKRARCQRMRGERIYPLLDILESKGLLTYWDEPTTNGRSRSMIRLTDPLDLPSPEN